MSETSLLSRTEVKDIAQEAGRDRAEKIKDAAAASTQRVREKAGAFITTALGAPEAIGAQTERAVNITQEKIDEGTEVVKQALEKGAEAWDTFFEKVGEKGASLIERMKERKNAAVERTKKIGRGVVAVGLKPIEWGEKTVAQVYQVPEKIGTLQADAAEFKQDVVEFKNKIQDAFESRSAALLEQTMTKLEERTANRLETLDETRAEIKDKIDEHKTEAEKWRTKRDAFNNVQQLRKQLKG